MTKNLLIASLLIACISCGKEESGIRARAESVLNGAVSYLESKQGEDGGWHSETHGILRGGQAWTPFVMLALDELPEEVHSGTKERLETGLAFIRSHVNEQGALGLSDPDVLEYPNYATAYALRLLDRVGGESDQALMRRMQSYLVNQQLTEHRGFTGQDPVYGAWGFGETNLPPGNPGFADLSHTRRVLQALRDTGYSDSSAYRKSELFLRFLQKHPSDGRKQGDSKEESSVSWYDGGFYFSPAVPARNKGGLDEAGVFRSYATATCDGVLALHLAGVSRDDERVMSALNWLGSHSLLARPEGIPEDSPEHWDEVMFFYHLMVRSEVYSTFGSEEPWREEIIGLLEKKQNADGSFSNPQGELNKEDDPILATAMAVYTLANVIR